MFSKNFDIKRINLKQVKKNQAKPMTNCSSIKNKYCVTVWQYKYRNAS